MRDLPLGKSKENLDYAGEELNFVPIIVFPECRKLPPKLSVAHFHFKSCGKAGGVFFSFYFHLLKS